MSLDINRFKNGQGTTLPKFKSDSKNDEKPPKKQKISTKTAVLLTVGCIAVMLLITIWAIIYGQKNPQSKFEYHKNNVNIISNTIDATLAENIVSAMEKSNVITKSYKMVSEDIIPCGEGEYEIYVGVLLRVVTSTDAFKLYIFKTKYSVNNSVLLFDSSNESSLKVLEQQERENFKKSQRKYLVESTIKITPSIGILSHNALGGSQLSFSVKNVGNTDIGNISITIAPGFIGYGGSKLKAGTYTTYESITVGQIKEYTLNPKGWVDYDTFNVIEVIIYFSDGTAIKFDEYDCQFL